MTKKFTEEHFAKYNANNRNKPSIDDSAVRAIAVIEGISWGSALSKLIAASINTGLMPGSKDNVEYCLTRMLDYKKIDVAAQSKKRKRKYSLEGMIRTGITDDKELIFDLGRNLYTPVIEGIAYDDKSYFERDVKAIYQKTKVNPFRRFMRTL